ncbi:uncharacterized protein BJX67DRAFT_363203 [Aspergillus lucknowensis]|uniref:Sex determining protein n=1 Tax=Aspergillus lucknowensis TaxID=176173 RepID=A0ABR4LJE3_9EURO
MFNPWGTHNPGHAHAHTHTHGGHGHAHGHGHTHTTASAPNVTSVSVPATVSAAAARMDLDSSPSHTSHSQSPPQPSYQMSQMRWLPSMVTPRSHNHNASLPTISSNLRLQHPHPHPHSQHQQQQQQQQHAQAPGSVIAESRAPPPALVNAAAQGRGQQQVVESVESEESDRSESPGETTSGTRDVSGADALGDPDYAGRNSLVGVERGDGDVNGEGGANGGKDAGDMAHMAQPGNTNLTPRKHGKRLTTKEEVSLFEICNRHAAEFGRRSNLCKWWMTVTMEFTRGQKHPYSWHSVRRKVEIVTKQRMKFLEEQRDKGNTEADDLSNPRWRAVVDAWIPTWQRWEEAEARRIEKRDSRRPRKRKWTVTTPASTTITTDGQWDLPNANAAVTAADTWRAPSSTTSSPMVSHTIHTHNHTPQTHIQTQTPQPLATPKTAATSVRLPPGFDTMFAQRPSPSSSSPAANPTSDNTMMAAVLETLGKLNKHLDSSSTPSLLPPTTEQHPSSSSQQVLVPGPENPNGLDDGLQNIPPTALTRLKEELKKEMLGDLRSEWDKERAVLEEKLDSVQRTQEMILEMLRQEPT